MGCSKTQAKRALREEADLAGNLYRWREERRQVCDDDPSFIIDA